MCRIYELNPFLDINFKYDYNCIEILFLIIIILNKLIDNFR